MSVRKSDTRLFLGEGVMLPLRSAMTWKEDWAEVGDIQFRDTWGGETHVLNPVHKPKFNMSLSASGNGVWRTPSLSGLQSGMTITMHSAKWITDYIPQGEDSTRLLRLAVPGSIRVVTRLEQEWDHTTAIADGVQTVFTLPAPEGGLAVIFNPILVMRVGRFNTDADGSGRSAGWSVELREKSAPK